MMNIFSEWKVPDREAIKITLLLLHIHVTRNASINRHARGHIFCTYGDHMPQVFWERNIMSCVPICTVILARPCVPNFGWENMATIAYINSYCKVQAMPPVLCVAGVPAAGEAEQEGLWAALQQGENLIITSWCRPANRTCLKLSKDNVERKQWKAFVGSFQ